MKKTILCLLGCTAIVFFTTLVGSCGQGIIKVGDDEFDDAWYPVRSFTSLGQVDNLAPNPGFESNPSADYSTTGNALFLWSGKERTGHHAIRIKSRTAGGSVALWFSKPERIPVAPGGTYDSSGWMIGRRVDQYGALGMVFYDSGLNRLQDLESTGQVRGTTDWRQLAVSATAPSGAAFLSVEFRLYGKGDIYLDDLVVLGANDCVPDCGNIECGLDPVCQTQNCGDCLPPKTCGGGGAPNVCGCNPETDAAFCARLGKSCGAAAGTDNCGASRSASCGECPASCGNGRCEAGEDCASCAADCGQCPITGNKKNISRYSNKQVFIVSDADWRKTLALVPVATWTGNERCKKGYGTAAGVCAYPMLIFHSSSAEIFDFDSGLYFMQQFYAEKATLLGDIPSRLSQVLAAAAPDGSGLVGNQIERVSIGDLLSYWSDFSDLVYVEDNYRLALMAATYASLLNAPLVIQGTELDTATTFSGRKVICVGGATPPPGSCSERFDEAQLQQRFLTTTATDKIILLNPNDWNSVINTPFYSYAAQANFSDTYGKNSLVAPILASAKHEVIFASTTPGFQAVDVFVDSILTFFSGYPEYLTIVANPDDIEMAYWQDSLYLPADRLYAQTDADVALDLAVGRIFGITSSDASATVARSLFYDEATREPSMLFSAGSVSCGETRQAAYAKIFEAAGNRTSYTQYPGAADVAGKNLIMYDGHGSEYGVEGIGFFQLPKLNNPVMVAQACLTCGWPTVSPKTSLMCAMALRMGAVAFVGSVPTGNNIMFNEFLIGLFALDSPVGQAYRDAANTFEAKYMQSYVLLGDPTLRISNPHPLPRPRLTYSSTNGAERSYVLTYHAIKIENPASGCASPTTFFETVSLSGTNLVDASGARVVYWPQILTDCDLEGFVPESVLDPWKMKKERNGEKCRMWLERPGAYDDPQSLAPGQFHELSSTLSFQ